MIYDYSPSDSSRVPTDFSGQIHIDTYEKSSQKISSSREAAFIPSELARSQIKKIESEMRKMHGRHCQLLKDMDANYAAIERETHSRYIEFINKWKDQLKQKVEQYKRVIETLNMELTEMRDYAETTISSLRDKNSQLLKQKNELLVKFERDVADERERKEKAIASMQIAYEKQLENMQRDKQDVQLKLEEMQSEKLSLERYHDEILKQFYDMDDRLKDLHNERNRQQNCIDSLTREIISMTLNDLLDKVSGDTQEDSIQVKFNEEKTRHEYLKKKRRLIAKKITEWVVEFERENGRKCENIDKSAISSLYSRYSAINKELKQAENSLRGMKDSAKVHNLVLDDRKPPSSLRSNSHSPSLNISIDTSMSTPRQSGERIKALNRRLDSLESKESITLLKEELESAFKENEKLRRELRVKSKGTPRTGAATPTSVANSIITQSTTAENKMLKAEVDQLRQELSDLRKQMLDSSGLLPDRTRQDLMFFEEDRESWRHQDYRRNSQSQFEEALMEIDRLKAELESMKTYTQVENSDITTLKSQLAYTTTELTTTRQRLASLEAEKTSRQSPEQDLKKLKEDNSRLIQELHEYKELVQHQHTSHTQALQNLDSKHAEDLSKAQSKISKLTGDNDTLRFQLEEIEASYHLEKNEFTLKLKSFQKQAAESAQLGKQVENLTQQCSKLNLGLVSKQQELKDSFRQRKLLHNQLEDMKGKIRVYCRVRPLNDTESRKGSGNILNIMDEFTVICEIDPGRCKQFTYDGIYGPSANQDEVFEDTKRLVQSAVDGYNVCIFAYGQTGSGKTYTILGEADNPGITPRTINELFRLLNDMPERYEWQLSCYMVELYLDSLVDLFRENNKNSVNITIRTDPSGMVYLPEAYQHVVYNSDELMARYSEGISRRHTNKTMMNDSSSRSHLIFSILIEVMDKETNQRTVGKLSLVDLAGNERVAKSESNKERLRESNAINKSLTHLGNVIASLCSNESHVPYRNSKLTMLMSDSLGGTVSVI